MKIMGNELITQEEHDAFVAATITPLKKEIEDLDNQVKALFGGVLICVIGVAVLVVKLLH